MHHTIGPIKVNEYGVERPDPDDDGGGDPRAGALTTAEYTGQLAEAGFTEITLTRSHTVTEGLHSTIVRATKPQ